MTDNNYILMKGVWNTQRVNNFIAKNIDQNATIIDLGCGKGDRLFFVSRFLNYNSYGVEIFSDYAEEAKSKGLNIIQEDIKVFLENLNGPKDYTFIMIDVIEHFTDEDALFCIEKMKSLGNKILMFTPEGEFDQEEYDNNAHQKHLSVWSKDKLESLDFSVEVVQNFHVKEDGTESPVAFAIWSN